MGVVGADQGQSRLPVHPQQLPVHHSLVPDAVVLELQIEVLRPEDPAKLQGVVLRVFVLPVPQPPGNLPCKARGQGDQPAAVLPQELQIHPGTVVKALCPSHGDHVGEVSVSLLVLTQQHQMAALGVKLMELIEPGTALGGHIDLAADDGLDSLRLTGPVKVDNAVHNAVVGDGAGGLAHGLDNFGQIPDTARAVKEAVLRMDMQMDKGHRVIPPQNASAKTPGSRRNPDFSSGPSMSERQPRSPR